MTTTETTPLTADEAIQQALMDDCKSIKLGKIVVAVNAHESNHSHSMVPIISDDEVSSWFDLGKTHISKDLKPQEILYTAFNAIGEDEDLVALFYENHDTVIVCYEHTHEEGVNLEHYCTMTTAGFFKYLNTVPNLNRFAIHTQLFCECEKPLGLSLLDELASS
tara:strand:- start:831 stop:1322 length:492 start_codon:yes stop_codon:yes gene_type:complete